MTNTPFLDPEVNTAQIIEDITASIPDDYDDLRHMLNGSEQCKPRITVGRLSLAIREALLVPNLIDQPKTDAAARLVALERTSRMLSIRETTKPPVKSAFYFLIEDFEEDFTRVRETRVNEGETRILEIIIPTPIRLASMLEDPYDHARSFVAASYIINGEQGEAHRLLQFGADETTADPTTYTAHLIIAAKSLVGILEEYAH